MIEQVYEEHLKTPVTQRYDVLVVGAGSAGWTAAVSASRCGRRVMLVERNYEVGGTSTTAMMHLFGSTMENVHGIMKEIIDDLKLSGGIKVGPLSPYDGQTYCQYIFDMLERNHVALMMGVQFVKTIVDNNIVQGIIVESKSGRQAILADVIIDATGDGDVCASAGAEFIIGRSSDNKMRPISLLFRLGNIDSDKLIRWAKDHPEEFKHDTNSHILDDTQRLYRLHGFFNLAQQGCINGELSADCHYIRFEYVWPEKGIALINSTRVYGINALDPIALSKGIIEARKQIQQLFSFIRSHIPGCENSYIVDVSSMPGIRETRHIVGDYILTEEDLIQDTLFDDCLFRDYRRVSPGAEVHSPDGNEGAPGDNLEREGARELRTFTLPFRCFLPKGLENILVAGRCISATHQADGWTRDQPGCILMGQAVGICAALASETGLPLRRINLSEVKNRMAAAGMTVQ